MPATVRSDLILAQICCGTKRSADGPLRCCTDRTGREIAIADMRNKADAKFLRLRWRNLDGANALTEAFQLAAQNELKEGKR